MERMNSTDRNFASVIRNGGNTDSMDACGFYEITCVGPDGGVKWTDTAENVIVNEGKNSMLDTYFAGSGYTAAWYCSLITAGTATSTSTYASPTVTEITTGIVSGNARVAMGWSAASTGSKASTTTSFSITGTATITGNMIVMGGTGVATVGNTAATGGKLFSAANFSGGSKTVGNGDSLNVTYSVAV